MASPMTADTTPSPVEGREVIEAAYSAALHADLVMVQVPTAYLGNVLASTMYSAAAANWRHMLTEARARAEAAEANARRLAEALRPFARIEPSSLFPADGSEGEVYELFLTDDPCAPISGADLAKARAAIGGAQ